MIAAQPHATPEDRGRWSPYVSLFLLTFTYALNFLDRQILAILAEPIKRDLQLSDTQLGLLTGLAFAFVYVAMGVPLAWLADRAGRVRVVAAACALWSLFTSACGFAQSFTQLALARTGVAIGEAGGTAPSHSIVADLFPPARRALALAIYSMGVPIGVIVGGSLGGFVAQAWGWRGAFIVAGLPGLAVAALVLIVVRDPAKPAASTGQAAARPRISDVVRFYFGTPQIVLLSVAGALTAFVTYGMLNWAAALLMRAKGMSLIEIGAYYSWVVGIALGIGTFLGGYIVDRFGERSPRVYALAPAAALIVAVPFFLGALSAGSWRLSLALLAVPLAMVSMYLAPALALVQNLTPPNMRATAAAILLLVLNLVGLGCGPLFVGLVSDRLQREFGADGLTLGMAALTPFFALSVAFYFGLARLMRRAGI